MVGGRNRSFWAASTQGSVPPLTAPSSLTFLYVTFAPWQRQLRQTRQLAPPSGSLMDFIHEALLRRFYLRPRSHAGGRGYCTRCRLLMKSNPASVE